MSTYASAIVVDADTADGAQATLARLRAQPDFDEDAAIVTGIGRRGDLHRLAVYAPFFAVSSDLGDELLAGVANGRALAADDFDEYGARFTAWSVADRVATVVYRVTIEGDSEGDDPPSDVVGAPAVAELATLWGVEADRLLAIDADLGSLADDLGIVGGPFPWFDALDVPWPGG